MRYLLVLLWCISSFAQAGIYKSYDKNGNVVFTDTPSNDAQEVADKPIVTIPALPKALIDQQKAKSANKNNVALEPSAYKVIIENLKPNDSFRREDKSVTANIQLVPPLWKEHHLQLTLDGKALSQDNFSPQIDLTTAERGQHRLEVKAVNLKGTVLGSEVVDFFVQVPTAIKPKTK